MVARTSHPLSLLALFSTVCFSVLFFFVSFSEGAACTGAGTSPSTSLFAESKTAGCSGSSVCFAKLCDCMGSPGGTDGNSCLSAATSVPCLDRQFCLSDLFFCLVRAVEVVKTQDACTDWATPIYLKMLDYASTNTFLTNDIYTHCAISMCGYNYNGTTDPKLCSTSSSRVCACAAPLYFETNLTLTGRFDRFFFNTSQYNLDAMHDAIQQDFANLFITPICIAQLNYSDVTKFVVTIRVPMGYSMGVLQETQGSTVWMGNTRALYYRIAGSLLSFGTEGFSVLPGDGATTTTRPQGDTTTADPGNTNETTTEDPGTPIAGTSLVCFSMRSLGLAVIVLWVTMFFA